MGYKRIELLENGVHIYESNHLKGGNVSRHYHDIYQILYVLNGEGTIIIDDQPYELSKDKLILIVPNSAHAIQARSKLTVLVLAFSESAFGITVNKGLLNYMEGKSQFYELDSLSASEIRQLLRKMLFEQTDYDALCKVASPIYLMEILLILVRLQKTENPYDANDIRSLRIKEYINKNYFENITAETLSAKFGLSIRYMNDIFKGKYQNTPLQYLQKVRINRAKELLLETDKDVVSICFEVGYETVSSFYRTFNNLVGTTPHKFRFMGKTPDA